MRLLPLKSGFLFGAFCLFFKSFFRGCPGTYSVDQDGFELTEILLPLPLPLPPEC